MGPGAITSVRSLTKLGGEAIGALGEGATTGNKVLATTKAIGAKAGPAAVAGAGTEAVLRPAADYAVNKVEINLESSTRRSRLRLSRPSRRWPCWVRSCRRITAVVRLSLRQRERALFNAARPQMLKAFHWNAFSISRSWSPTPPPRGRSSSSGWVRRLERHLSPIRIPALSHPTELHPPKSILPLRSFQPLRSLQTLLPLLLLLLRRLPGFPKVLHRLPHRAHQTVRQPLHPAVLPPPPTRVKPPPI